MSRFARGEGWETQRQRLRSYLKTDELHTHPQLYAQVHRLDGLGGCIAEHAVIPRRNGNPSNRKVRSGPIHISVSNHSHPVVVGHDLWMNRPLPDEYLHYASQDAYLIYSLYNYFARVGYLSLITVEQTMRYISLHRCSPPHREDVYVSHPLLPLGINAQSTVQPKHVYPCSRSPPLKRSANTLSAGPLTFDSTGPGWVFLASVRRLRSHIATT
jgi:exonuclease 3'-5' domain-containing protein 1